MLWASQTHIADIFEIERSVVTKHIRNILRNKELDENSVRAKLAHTAEDGKSYQVQLTRTSTMAVFLSLSRSSLTHGSRWMLMTRIIWLHKGLAKRKSC